MLKRYIHTEPMSSYKVDKALIRDIEDYYIKQVPNYIDVEDPLVNDMLITIHTGKRKASYRSINEYQNDFPNNHINTVIIDRSYYDAERGIVLSTRFDRHAEDSCVQTCVYDDREPPIL